MRVCVWRETIEEIDTTRKKMSAHNKQLPYQLFYFRTAVKKKHLKIASIGELRKEENNNNDEPDNAIR